MIQFYKTQLNLLRRKISATKAIKNEENNYGCGVDII